MKRVGSERSVLILCGLLLLVVGLLPVSAQGENLLTNPGFEPPFETIDGAPPRVVAQGWQPWHVPAAPGMSASENVQPEYYPSTDEDNGLGVARVRSGEDAQQYLSFFATHIGGVYQVVSGVTAGDALRFSVYAYLWSSTFDAADESEDDGGLVLQVGIDPTGGTDGESDAIIWSEAQQTYDSFAEYVITAEAAADTVSVWVRSSLSFPVKNNVVYLDDASLTIEASDTAPTTAAPTETAFPPTATATQVPPTATFTATLVPATATNTDAPPTAAQASATPLPPTATNTDVPPTATLTATPVLPTATNTDMPPTATFTPQPSPTLDRTQFPVQLIYTVQAGDIVVQIAQAFGSTVDAIITANGLNENGLIFVGQQLIIPLASLPTSTVTATPVSVTLTLAPATATPLPTTPAGITSILYIVQPGDSLSGIAVRFGTRVQVIAEANNILNYNLIFTGQRLTIPVQSSGRPPVTTVTPQPPVTGGIVYRVQPGDNLYFIALRFGVTVNALVQRNQLVNPSLIYVGQLITIP